MTDMTRAELKQLVDAAYDDYLDELDHIAEEAGLTLPASPRQVQDDPETHDAAAAAYAVFQHRQDELNDEYFAPRDARATERRKAKDGEHHRIILLAQAQENISEARLFLRQEETRIDAMHRAGIEVTDAEAAGIIAAAQAKIDHWRAVIVQLGG